MRNKRKQTNNTSTILPKMTGLNESASFVVSLSLSCVAFCAMMVLKPTLSATQLGTVGGGAMGSLVFLFLLTAVGNLEKTLLGRHFAARWAEVAFCMLVSAAMSATVHRVCATTCIVFSLLLLHGLHRLSQEVYEGDAITAASAPSSAMSGGARSTKRQ